MLDVDGTHKNLYVEKDKPMAEAIADAMRKVDKNATLDEGCKLGLKVSGFKPTNFNPMRMFSATYEPAPAGYSAPAVADEEPF